MDSDHDELGPDNALNPSGFLDSDGVRSDDGIIEHQSLARTNWDNAITSRDIDALVQLKLLRQRR